MQGEQGKEMANTSHRRMPVLGNVHPIKIENFDIFSWRHFSARSSFYILIDMATQEVPVPSYDLDIWPMKVFCLVNWVQPYRYPVCI